MEPTVLMRRALVAGAVALPAVGCAAIVGADFGGKQLAVCEPARAPGPPTVAGSGASISFVAAVRTVDWGEDEDDAGAPRYRAIGYDLDGRCTSLLDAPPCRPAAWTGAAPVDGKDGRDNAVGALLYDQRTAFGGQPFNSPYLNEAVARGEHAPIAVFRVSEYNGFADDDQVTVEWFLAGTLGAGGDGGAVAPKWDGNDAWPLVSTAADADDGGAEVRSRWVDAHAYVTHFRLVAKFGAGTQIRLANVPFTVTDAELAADIVPGQTATARELRNGLIVGHGTIAELLARLPELTQAFAGAVICTDAAAYPKIKRWLCATADTILSGAPGQGATCDAASFGVAIDTRPARLGRLIPPPAPPRCAPAVDPANDSCGAAAP